jgi:hypothetical protein
MDTADAVVKSYKASSTDTKVYLYVRDKDLNTTHTGTTEWSSTHPTTERIVDETSTWTLNLNGDSSAIVEANMKDQKVATLGTATAGLTNTGAGNRTAGAKNALATTTNGSGVGLVVDLTVAAGKDITQNTIVVDGGAGAGGVGYQVGDVITVSGRLLGLGAGNACFDAGTNCPDLVVPVASVALQNGAVASFELAEDSDQGVAGGPNLYEGADTSLKLNTLTIKKGVSSLVVDQLNESAGTFSLNADVAIGDTSGTDTVVASYSFSAQDIYTALAAGSKEFTSQVALMRLVNGC